MPEPAEPAALEAHATPAEAAAAARRQYAARQAQARVRTALRRWVSATTQQQRMWMLQHQRRDYAKRLARGPLVVVEPDADELAERVLREQRLERREETRVKMEKRRSRLAEAEEARVAAARLELESSLWHTSWAAAEDGIDRARRLLSPLPPRRSQGAFVDIIVEVCGPAPLPTVLKSKKKVAMLAERLGMDPRELRTMLQEHFGSERARKQAAAGAGGEAGREVQP